MTSTRLQALAASPSARGAARHRRLAGFALVELMMALSISAIVALYAAAALVRESEEVLAQGSGAYVLQVADAVQRHILNHHDALSRNLPVPGTRVARQPTLDELRTLGRLPASFPIQPGALPTRQSVRVDILGTNCPGPACVLTALVCTTTPLTLSGPTVRFDLAQVMVDRMQGAGGSALQTQGARIRGPLLDVANPLGNQPGVVCGSSVVDLALFNSFVRVRDLRDPDLQGNLSVAGSTALGGTVTVAGPLTAASTVTAGTTTIGTCAQIQAITGRAGFGCADPNDLPAGYAGGVRSPDVVANGRILASDDPGGFTGNNTNYAFMGLNGGLAEVRTSGRAAADRLVPTGSYFPGSRCSTADEGAIARRWSSPGLLVCQGTRWIPLQTGASAGDNCTPEGSVATGTNGVQLVCIGGTYRGMDTLMRAGVPGAQCHAPGTTAFATGNEILLCRENPASGPPARWMRLHDLTQNLVYVTTKEVTDVSVGPSGIVQKPSCSSSSGQVAVPLIFLIAKTVSSPDGGYALHAGDAGGEWQIYLRDGAFRPLLGNPSATALANMFCYYP